MSAVRKYNEDYYDGNSVRKLQSVPELDPRHQEYQEENKKREQDRRRRQQQRRKAAKAGKFDLKTLVFFSGALAVTVLTAINFLQTQAEERSLKRQITSLQQEILDIRDVNGSIKDMIVPMELSEVYRIATEELGMVHPNDSQIITYDSKKQDYHKQYDNIPEGVTTDIVSEILNK